MKRKLLFISIPIVLLMIVYFSGSKPAAPVFSKVMPTVPSEPAALEQYISQNESKHKIKPNNEARIVWADSSKRKTEYAVVYLHGFSASQMEGDPIHRDFAKEFGCNLYLSRLADHGIDTTESLLQFTADRFWESSKEALAIGKVIGDKIILMSTSTGGTTAVMMAADYPDDVYAIINLSPNIALKDPAAFLLNNPWGLQIARSVMGGNYREWVPDPERAKYWNSKYRLESLVQLEELVESSMNKETFSKIKQPSLTLYYYKNEEEQDPEVSVAAMLEMNKTLATPDSLKVTVAMPNAGAHVIGSSLVSKDVPGVYREIEKFAIEKLHLKPVSE
ncbi:MAG TPA: alpha/beta hydrolase [Cyclobacteriaceae bacterium]|nr:alpha/beta hydrolase [Cyclobacteriaceae bacterium]